MRGAFQAPWAVTNRPSLLILDGLGMEIWMRVKTQKPKQMLRVQAHESSAPFVLGVAAFELGADGGVAFLPEAGEISGGLDGALRR